MDQTVEQYNTYRQHVRVILYMTSSPSRPTTTQQHYTDNQQYLNIKRDTQRQLVLTRR